mgnify:CR=1 FL=1
MKRQRQARIVRGCHCSSSDARARPAGSLKVSRCRRQPRPRAVRVLDDLVVAVFEEIGRDVHRQNADDDQAETDDSNKRGNDADEDMRGSVCGGLRQSSCRRTRTKQSPDQVADSNDKSDRRQAAEQLHRTRHHGEPAPDGKENFEARWQSERGAPDQVPRTMSRGGERCGDLWRRRQQRHRLPAARRGRLDRESWAAHAKNIE